MKLTVDPEWHEIESARGETELFLRSHGFTDDSTQTLIMVISELIENGIKYGNFKSPEDQVRVNVHMGPNRITIEVVNPVDEKAFHHLKKLDKTIQWIRGYQDPFEAYVEKLKEVSRKPFKDEESGLGLVRIAYEGQAILDFFVGDNGMLNVSAVLNFNGDPYEKAGIIYQ